MVSAQIFALVPIIAVMFTFSFSSAFATVATSEEANLIKSASAYAQNSVATTIEQAYKAVLAASTNNVDYISEAAWAAASADIVKDIQEDIQATADGYLADTSTIADPTWDDYPTDMNYTAAKLFGTLYQGYTAWAADLNSDTNEYAVMAARAQFEMDYNDVVGVYDKIDLDALYSKTTPATGDSYYVQAQKAIAKSLETLKGIFFDAEGKVKTSYSTVSAYKGWVSSVESRVNGTIVDANITPVEKVVWEGTDVVKYYLLKSATIKTKDGEAVDDAATAAKTAALKAKIASNIANYAKDSQYDADFAADYAEVLNYLAENNPELSGLEALIDSHAVVATLKTYKTSNGAALSTAIETINSLKSTADRYAAEKDATGALVRDAKAVSDLVDKAKASEYTYAAGLGPNDYSAATAEGAIAGLNLATTASKLVFDKEAKKSDLADELEGRLDNYYALEAAALKAEYEKAYAAIDAATDASEFAAIVSDLTTATGADKIRQKAAVEALFTSVPAMSTEVNTQLTTLKDYLTYKNSGLASYEDAWANYGNDAKLKAQIVEYYIENNARTAAEMKALTGVVEAVAAGLPTTGELNVAAKVAKDAINAIPAKVTSADKATVVAAKDAIDAYNDLLEAAGKAPSTLTVAAKLTALDTALTNDYLLAFAKADKNDKAALKAIADEIKAVNDELADYGVVVDVPALTDALAKIKAAEKKAVEDAIKAIPINVTAADKATVQKARDLYDAYVAEYTDYTKGAPTDEGYVADDFGTLYGQLVAAEATLGLNEDPIAAVESLKIKASTAAYKGYIRLKWTVTGDAEAADGYQIYRSTKSSSGGKKIYTTKKATTRSFKNTSVTKGTKYYYKVRAFKVVDGVTYYSDWSTRGIRTAK